MSLLIDSTAFLTDVGKVRSHNEDNGGIFVSPVGTLVVVADGMGGHSAGDIASKIATEVLESEWNKMSNPLKAIDAETFLLDSFKRANEAIITYAQQHPECEGMGTTAIAAVCTEEYTAIAHVGDSRAYVYNGIKISQQTEDHSLVAELVRSGQITAEEAEHHPRKNVVLRALGTDPDVSIDVFILQSDLINVLIVCSDGLSNKLKASEVQAEIERGVKLSEVAESLIAQANDRGGEDNITIALVRFNEEISESL